MSLFISNGSTPAAAAAAAPKVSKGKASKAKPIATPAAADVSNQPLPTSEPPADATASAPDLTSMLSAMMQRLDGLAAENAALKQQLVSPAAAAAPAVQRPAAAVGGNPLDKLSTATHTRNIVKLQKGQDGGKQYSVDSHFDHDVRLALYAGLAESIPAITLIAQIGEHTIPMGELCLDELQTDATGQVAENAPLRWKGNAELPLAILHNGVHVDLQTQVYIAYDGKCSWKVVGAKRIVG